MAHIPQPLADLATGVLRLEVGNAEAPSAFAGALERACLALHERLAPLISSQGFEALLTRSVKLASRDFSFLSAVTVTRNTGCSFSGLSAALEPRGRDEAGQAVATVLGRFFHLLVIFIGEDLGLRKVREAWPEVPFRRGDSITGTDR